MHIVKPFSYTVVPINTDLELLKIYYGYRRCYSDKVEDFIEFKLDKDLRLSEEDRKKVEEFIRKMRKTPHESPLEHVSITFVLENVSRALTHQLVRHRLASYSQQSQRYVQMDDLPIVMPEFDYINDEETKKTVQEIVAQTATYCENAYADLVAFDVKPEDARSVLPNCTATQIVVTMNLRALLHFFEERMCWRAQSEIRTEAQYMWDECYALFPCVFEGTGPKCMRQKRCPEHYPCGKKPYVRVEARADSSN